jgi:hypothetical protein
VKRKRIEVMIRHPNGDEQCLAKCRSQAEADRILKVAKRAGKDVWLAHVYTPPKGLP